MRSEICNISHPCSHSCMCTFLHHHPGFYLGQNFVCMCVCVGGGGHGRKLQTNGLPWWAKGVGVGGGCVPSHTTRRKLMHKVDCSPKATFMSFFTLVDLPATPTVHGVAVSICVEYALHANIYCMVAGSATLKVLESTKTRTNHIHGTSLSSSPGHSQVFNVA